MKTKTYMALFLPIVALAGLNGCMASPGLPGGYNVQISSEFNADEISGIETGMQEWAQYKDGPSFAFEIVSPFSLPQERNVPWGAIVVKKDTPANIKTTCNDSNALACTEVSGELAETENGEFDLRKSPIGATIYLPGQDQVLKSTDTAMWIQALAHETGHAMGLHHTAQGTVMCHSLDCAAKTPTCDDLQYYCNLRNVSCACDEKD